FATYLEKDLQNEHFKQEVENVARFLHFMDPQQPSLLFVRNREKSKLYLDEAKLTKQTPLNHLKSLKRDVQRAVSMQQFVAVHKVQAVHRVHRVSAEKLREISERGNRPEELSVVVVYRPLPGPFHNFIEELDVLLSSFPEDNVHLEKHYASDFHTLAASFDLTRLATAGNHRSGNQLDLIYTRNFTTDKSHTSSHFCTHGFQHAPSYMHYTYTRLF
ncbi:reverse transcriptase, partial [Triplophysa rosa]